MDIRITLVKDFMDKKDTQFLQKTSAIDVLDISQEVRSFIGNKEQFFAVQKAERLTSVVYLLIQFTDMTDPLIIGLKSQAVTVLATISQLDAKQHVSYLSELRMQILGIVSSLKVIAMSGHIAETHAKIVCEEYLALYAYIAREYGGFSFAGASLQEKVGEKLESPSGIDKGHDKGHSGVAEVKRYSAKRTLAKAAMKNDSFGGVGAGAEKTRRELLLEVLQEKGQITIKDASFAIRDCSEKTLQRELGVLVSQGLVRREGERRWSKYSLV